MIDIFMRNDMHSREPSELAVCETAMRNREISRKVGYSLEACKLLYAADPGFREDCMKIYNLAEGFKRGD